MANRVLLGRALSGGSPVYGLFVSRPGVNVVDGSGNLANTRDLLFDSRLQEQANIIASGSTSVTHPASTRGAVTHGFIYYNADQTALDYIPIVMFASKESNWLHRPGRPTTFVYAPNDKSPLGAYGDYTSLVAIDITTTRFRFQTHYYGSANNAAFTLTIAYWVLAMGRTPAIEVGP